MGEFGEKLRSQREKRGITLEAISNTTKISTRMLKALEDERFDQLPGGVFNKGFVRAYARQIGLDAEEAVGDYLAALRESQVQAHTIMPEFHLVPAEPARQQHELEAATSVSSSALDHDRAASPPEPPFEEASPSPPKEQPRRKLLEQRPPKPTFRPAARIPWGMVAIGLLVVALLLAFLSYHPRTEHRVAAQPAKPAVEQEATSERAGNIPAATPPPAPIMARSRPSVPPSSSLPATAAPTPGVSAVVPAAAASNSPASTPTTLSGKPSGPPNPVSPRPGAVEKEALIAKSPANASAPEPPAATPASQARAAAASDFTLLIRAEETAWVSITADGRLIAQETLIAPAEKSIRAGEQIVVHTGNAGGLVFLLNGKPLPKQGDPGEVRTFSFDSRGMHVVLPPPAASPQ